MKNAHITEAPTFDPKNRLLLVSINRTAKRLQVKDATRYAWRLDRRRLDSVELVLGCENQVVKGVYVVSEWLDASPGEASRKNFPGFVANHKGRRWGFKGEEASELDQRHYMDKRVPDSLKIGQNGVRYFRA